MRGLALVGLLVTLATATQTQAATPCSGPEHRQLDFWAGDWDAYDIAEPTMVVARTHVTPMFGGCALRATAGSPTAALCSFSMAGSRAIARC